MQELARQGHAEAVPRVGTVVAHAQASNMPPKDRVAELSLARVVRTAVEIADAEGLEALSIRGVAARLGAPPMSLYRHIQGKENLIERMIATTLEEGAPARRDWRGLAGTTRGGLRAWNGGSSGATPGFHESST